MPAIIDWRINFFKNPEHPFQGNGVRNDYAIFADIISRYGVYIFQDRSNNEILYVGEAYRQDLKERITQNYMEGDNSGGFRKNWCEMNNQDFDAFKTAMRGWRITTMSVASRSYGNWIHALEAVLIGLLQPRYNRF